MPPPARRRWWNDARLLWATIVLLAAAALGAGTVALRPGARALTQKDIDAAVLRTLETPGYRSADHRIEIRAHIGFGDVSVEVAG